MKYRVHLTNCKEPEVFEAEGFAITDAGVLLLYKHPSTGSWTSGRSSAYAAFSAHAWKAITDNDSPNGATEKHP